MNSSYWMTVQRGPETPQHPYPSKSPAILTLRPWPEGFHTLQIDSAWRQALVKSLKHPTGNFHRRGHHFNLVHLLIVQPYNLWTKSGGVVRLENGTPDEGNFQFAIVVALPVVQSVRDRFVGYENLYLRTKINWVGFVFDTQRASSRFPNRNRNRTTLY